jgi:hypothetical protein
MATMIESATSQGSCVTGIAAILSRLRRLSS